MTESNLERLARIARERRDRDVPLTDATPEGRAEIERIAIESAWREIVREIVEGKNRKLSDAQIDEIARLLTEPAPANPCRWSAGCDSEAVTAVPHPILGDVPCCQPCADFAMGAKR